MEIMSASPVKSVIKAVSRTAYCLGKRCIPKIGYSCGGMRLTILPKGVEEPLR